MTKVEFLEDLKKELKKNNVVNEKDINEILYQYEEHFNCKLEEGKTEQEIVARLGSPKDIAMEYFMPSTQTTKFDRGVRITGITFLSIPLFFVYILIWCSVVVVGAFSLVGLVTGFCLITTINIAGLIPSIPYFPSFVLGIGCFGLALLSAIGAIYMFLYAKQWGLVYVRWCKNMLNNSKYPPLSVHPQISKKASSIYKLLAILGVIIFVVALVLGYIIMCLMANSFEPWHTWNWFV